jgi:hypothetical protein
MPAQHDGRDRQRPGRRADDGPARNREASPDRQVRHVQAKQGDEHQRQTLRRERAGAPDGFVHELVEDRSA